MSIEAKLTEIEKQSFINANSIQKNLSLKKDCLNIELDDNFYENLFLEEMDFHLNPKKDKIINIIRQYCKAVEYFSSIEDNKKVSQYKTLIDLFLNNPVVISLLDNTNNNNNSMEKILISNKNNEMKKLLDEDNKLISKNNNIICKGEEQDKLDKLINKNENMIKNRPSVDLVKEEINNQKNNFQKNLLIKKNSLFKKGKNINENKLIQSIQNAFINEKKDNQTIIYEEKSNNSSNFRKIINPIKNREISNNKENISNNILNSFSFSNNQKNENNKKNISQLNIIVNKKKTSEFELLTPEIFSKFTESNNKTSKNKDYINNSEEIIETKDFSLNNENFSVSEEKNKIPKNIPLLKYNNIYSNETKETDNINFSIISNSSQISKNLNDSPIRNNKFKNFRLDFNDLFEFMKESNNISNKQKIFCNDIKLIIENYIKDYNQYLNENIFIKFVKKFSNLWDDMFKKYVNISEIYENELKNLDEKINNFINDESKIKEYENLSENLKNERDNEINKSEEQFSSEIDSISLNFKNNYNNTDKGTLLLNEKFALKVTKKVFDMINNI